MKLSKKIKAIITLLTIAIISVVGAACGGQKVEFKFIKELPAQINYGTELYFRDYLPLEYGQDYKLYASYFNVDEQKEIVDEEHDALAFSFDFVSDYKFKIVRNGKDTVECEIASYPQVPRVIEGKVINQTAKETNVQSFERLLIIGYGSLPLENNKEATADPDYEIKATSASFQSVEIDGTDIASIDVSSGSIKIDKQGYYKITYTATNRAGTDSAVLTIRTVDPNNHVDTLDGYLLENGEGLDDNQLFFEMESMPVPGDGETIRVRYGEGKGADSAIYDAKYDAFTGKYVIDGFKHELTTEKAERIYLEGVDGKLYSTTVTLPTIITQETIDEAGSASQLYNATEGYVLLGSDIDLANYPFNPSTVFTGVLDGDGHVISNLTGAEVTDALGRVSVTGTSLFYHLENATVKNVTLNGVRATTGMLSQRVEGTLRLKNVIARLSTYVGARTSLLGYHAELGENAYVESVIIEMPTQTVAADGSYVGMLTTHAGGKTYIENLVLVGGNGLIHSTKGNNASFTPKHYTNRAESTTGMVEENLDYFKAPSAEVVFDCAQNGYVNDFLLSMAGKISMVVALDNDNIDRLLTATSGYYYLTEDIDMAGKEWAPTQGATNMFTGVINGDGHTIENFTSPAGYAGLVGYTGLGATFKNLNIHAVTNTSKGLLIGQVKGTTTVSNLTIEVDEMVAGYSGAIANVVQGELTVKDSYILIKSVSGSPNADGFIAGGEADSKNVIVSNVKVADATGVYADPYTGFVNKVGVTLGVDGLPAVNGEDYHVNVGDLLYLNLDEIEDEVYKALLEKAVEEVEKTIVMLNQENFASVLQSQGNGYYMLEEDVDLSDVTWQSGASLTGTLNGQGYTVSNFNGNALFSGFAGTIKNIKFINASYTGNGFLSASSVSAKVTIEDSTFDMNLSTGARSSLLGFQVGGTATLTDVNIVMPETTSGYVGFITSHAISSLVLDNVTMIGGTGNIHSTIGNHTTLVVGEGTITGSYKIYTVDEFIDACMGEDPSEEYIQLLEETNLATAITNENIDLLQTATSGYFYLAEDIDMEGKTWAPTQGGTNMFTGTLNGRGLSIKNFTSPAGYAGLVGYAGAGATFKNLNIHAITNTAKGVLIGQVKGATTVSNLTIEVDKMVAGYSGAIANVVQGELTVKDSYILIKSVVGTPKGDGFIAGGEAESKNVIVSNVKVADATGVYADPYTGYVNKVGVTLGVDGLPAVNGEDYFVNVGDLLDLNLDEIEDEVYKALLEKAVEEVKKKTVILNQENFASVLQSQGNGYYMLEEDVDLSDVTWQSGASLTGTLNGKGYTVSNFNGNNLFSGISGTIKNIKFINANHTGIGFLSASNTSANVTIENSLFDLVNTSGARKALIGYQVGGIATLTNVDIVMPTVTADMFGFVTCHAITGLALDNVKLIGGTGKIHSVSGNNAGFAYSDDKVTGTYKIYTMGEFVEACLAGELSEDLIKLFENKNLTTAITNENIELLQTATSGYFVLAEDIDMAGKTWAPTQGGSNMFTGTLNGNGHAIKNFTAPTGYLGLVGYTGAGATFKNLKVHAVTNGSMGVLIGQVKGATTVENCVIDVDAIDGNHGAGIAVAVQGPLTVNNVLINIDVANATYGVGFVGGKAAASANVTVSNGFFVSGDGKLTNVFAGDNEDKTTLKETTLGVDGQLAVEGEDYVVVTKLSDIERDKLTTDFLKACYDALIG